jgi:hypothetical protein
MPCNKKICKWYSPKRLLIPFSGLLFVLPFIFKENLMFATVPLFYFLGLYFIFLNFPKIIESINKKPLYLKDLKDEIYGTNQKFYKSYISLMNFILAALFAGLAEYIFVKGIKHKPVAEVLAVIGGNMSLYLKFQHFFGSLILKLCYCCKIYMLKRDGEDNAEIEMVDMSRKDIDSEDGIEIEEINL